MSFGILGFSRGYWHQRAGERLGNCLPKGGSRSLYWSETGMEDPKRTSWQCTASVCVAGVHCWEIFGVSRSMERDLLSVLSIYPRIFLRVFTMYRLLVGFFLCYCILLYVRVC